MKRDHTIISLQLSGSPIQATSKKMVGGTVKVTIEKGSAILKKGTELHGGDFVICSYYKPIHGEPCVLFDKGEILDILPYNSRRHKGLDKMSVIKIGTANIKDIA